MKYFKALLSLTALLTFGSYSVNAQDTIITLQKDTLIYKIIKITDTDVEYKKSNDPDAITFVISKQKIKEIRLHDGTVEKMNSSGEDQLKFARSAVKFSLFSPVVDQLVFGYERSLRRGINIESAAGLINNSMFPFSLNNANGNYDHNYLIQGVHISAGVKFILEQTQTISGSKYGDRLRGLYFMPELKNSTFAVRNLNKYYYYMKQIYSDYVVNSTALMISLGDQFVIGKHLAIGVKISAGYCVTESKLTNPDFNSNGSEYSFYTYNLYSFHRYGNIPLCYSGSITIGYIF